MRGRHDRSNLRVEDTGLYGGTKHTVATALGQRLTPEEIRRSGTGSKTNKVFERYFQPQKSESIKVITAIKESGYILYRSDRNM